MLVYAAHLLAEECESEPDPPHGPLGGERLPITEPEPKLPSPADDQPGHASRLRRAGAVRPACPLSSPCLPHQLVERRDDVIMRGLLNVPPVGVERERDPRMPNLVGDEPNISARAQEMT